MTISRSSRINNFLCPNYNGFANRRSYADLRCLQINQCVANPNFNCPICRQNQIDSVEPAKLLVNEEINCKVSTIWLHICNSYLFLKSTIAIVVERKPNIASSFIRENLNQSLHILVVSKEEALNLWFLGLGNSNCFSLKTWCSKIPMHKVFWPSIHGKVM